MDEFLRKNYFELFALPLQFDIDLLVLREKYRELQKAVHPDRFTAEAAQSQRLALQYTAQANQAFQTLKDPVSRGFYLLELLGHSNQPESATIQDGMFLMRQMELRERMENADASELEAMLHEVDDETGELEQQISQSFQQIARIKNFDQAEALLKKMQFYKRLLQEIEERI